jgi:hypothetical protein
MPSCTYSSYDSRAFDTWVPKELSTEPVSCPASCLVPMSALCPPYRYHSEPVDEAPLPLAVD